MSVKSRGSYIDCFEFHMAYFISSRLWKYDFLAIIVSKVTRGIPALYSKEELDEAIYFHYSRSTNSYYAGNIKEYVGGVAQSV